jgi:radical SAM protein with 4Fe4S-binding SPASM domain
VDGSTPERFDFLRHRRRRTPDAQKALFNEVIEGIRMSVESGLKIHANFALTRANRDDLEATYDLVMDLGARDLLAIKFFAGGRGLDYVREMEFPYREWAATMLSLTRAKMSGALPKLALSVPSAWEFYLPLRDAGMDVEQAERIWRYRSPLREPYYSRSGSIGDPSGIADLNVVANGDVYPITLMSGNHKALCGNTKTAALQEIWRTSATLSRLRGMRLDDLPAQCGSCDINHLCGGGSRARALVHSGSLAGGDLTCPKLGDSEGLIG